MGKRVKVYLLPLKQMGVESLSLGSLEEHPFKQVESREVLEVGDCAVDSLVIQGLRSSKQKISLAFVLEVAFWG